MTERMERKRLDLIARQQAGEMMPCPALWCGQHEAPDTHQRHEPDGWRTVRLRCLRGD